MENSRKGKRSRKKELPTPDPHVDGGNGKKAIVYNTKKEEKKERRTKNRLKKERERERERERENKKVEEIQQQKGRT